MKSQSLRETLTRSTPPATGASRDYNGVFWDEVNLARTLVNAFSQTREQQILGKRCEYIDPKKLGTKLGKDDYTIPEAISTVVSMVNSNLSSGQQILRVSTDDVEEAGVALASPFDPPGKRFELLPENHDFAKQLPLYQEMAESFEQCLARAVKDQEERKATSKHQLDLKQIDLEREKEHTKRLQLETDLTKSQANFMLELAKLGKTDIEIV
jgi:hypothetical protein